MAAHIMPYLYLDIYIHVVCDNLLNTTFIRKQIVVFEIRALYKPTLDGIDINAFPLNTNDQSW